MMNTLQTLRRTVRTAKMWSPVGFLTRAVLFVVLYVIFDLAGARAYTTFLSGTVPQGPFGQTVASYLGVAYLLLYLLAYVVAPILVVAAAIFWCVERCLLKQGQPPNVTPTQ